MLERKFLFRLIPFILIKLKDAHQKGLRPSPDVKWHTLTAMLLILLYRLCLRKLVETDVLELCEKIVESARNEPIVTIGSMLEIVRTGVKQPNILFFSSDESFGWNGPTSAVDNFDLATEVKYDLVCLLDKLAPLSDYDLIYLANDLWKREYSKLNLKGEKRS